MGEIRVILEKIKPVELKLKYQIEKYIKMTSAGDNDVLKKSDFRARMENLEVIVYDIVIRKNKDEIAYIYFVVITIIIIYIYS